MPRSDRDRVWSSIRVRPRETGTRRSPGIVPRSAWTLAVYGAFWGTAAWVLLRDYQTWLAVTAAFFGFALSGVMLVAGYLRRIPWSKAAD